MNDPRPTNVRHIIVFVAMLAAVLLYLERVCVSVAEVYIREDLRIGKMAMDVAFGAFFIAYALGQVPAGWLSLRFGPRLMMTLYMVGWSVFGVFIALAQDVYTLIAARFLLGLSQAGAYPTAVMLVKRWVPDRHRGLASGVVAFGGRFGGAGATWLTGMLIVAFVPLSVPATVTADDILQIEPFESARVDRLTKNMADDSGVRYVEIKDRIEWAMPLPGVPREPLTRESIAEAVNEAIRAQGIFHGINLSSLALATDGREIVSKGLGRWSSEESERLNRLVIEKTFPGAIRQLHVAGWRPTLLIYGVAGIVVGGLFWLLTRNWPREHPWANAAEVELIESGQSQASQAAGTSAVPWWELAASRNQWCLSVNQFFANIGWVFLITLLPRFLDERFHVPVDQRGRMTTVPLLTAAVGLPIGGWFTDWLSRRIGLRWGRAIPIGALKFPCAVALVTCAFLPDAWAVVAALAFMSVCQDFGVPAGWAFAQDTGGKQVGAVLGWANMWGNLGAGIGPPLMGYIAKHEGWDAVLFAEAFAFAMCGIAGMMTNAARPLFPSRNEPPG